MVSISSVGIGNLALANIGTNATIETFNENSAEAKQLNRWYNFARQQALESFNWSFARKRQALALASDDPPDDWAYRYQYPSDCVALRLIVNPVGKDADAIPYDIISSEDGQTKTIVCNLEDAVAEYTFDVTSTTLFTALFIEALSFLLAYHIAYPLTQNKQIRDDMFQTYWAVLRLAAASNGNETVPDKPRDAEWVRGR